MPFKKSTNLECLPSGWSIGATFRFCGNASHRIYEGPPDGTPRVRIGPEELYMDFTETFRISGIYVNPLFTAVSFKVAGASDCDPSESELEDICADKPAGEQLTTVWTNARKHSTWWAKLVHDL